MKILSRKEFSAKELLCEILEIEDAHEGEKFIASDFQQLLSAFAYPTPIAIKDKGLEVFPDEKKLILSGNERIIVLIGRTVEGEDSNDG